MEIKSLIKRKNILLQRITQYVYELYDRYRKKWLQLRNSAVVYYNTLKKSTRREYNNADRAALLRQFSSLNETLKPYRIPTFVICMGVVSSILGFLAALQSNLNDREDQFLDYVYTQETTTSQILRNYLEDMELSQHFFKTSSWVTKEDFATFIAPLKKRGNFSLFTRIDYEAEEERLSILQAHIADNTISNTKIDSLLKEQDVIKGLRKAKEVKTLVTTNMFSLNNGEEYNIAIIFPYYTSTLGIGRDVIDGFVLGVLNLKSVFSKALDWEENRKNIATYIFDTSDDNKGPIYAADEEGVSFKPNTSDKITPEFIEKSYPFYHKTEVQFADKLWEIFFVPTNFYLSDINNSFPWVTLTGGIIITSLIGLFMFYQANRNLEVSRLVEERTRDLEEAMKRLTRSNIELERFAYVASHDLKEPLRLVSNFTSILYQDYRSKFDKDGKEYVDIIMSETEHMQELIKGLLEYAQIEKRTELPKEEANCQKLLKRVLKNLSMKIKETNAQITHDKMPTVIGYTIPLVQLFQNLIGNALKYCRSTPPKIHIGCEDKGDHWLFFVKDNGIGIKEEHYKLVFEPFKRLHRKDEYEGTGIGLAICKKTVDYLAGKMWVESAYGEGSTFYFTIPKTDQRKKEVEQNT